MEPVFLQNTSLNHFERQLLNNNKVDVEVKESVGLIHFQNQTYQIKISNWDETKKVSWQDVADRVAIIIAKKDLFREGIDIEKIKINSKGVTYEDQTFSHQDGEENFGLGGRKILHMPMVDSLDEAEPKVTQYNTEEDYRHLIDLLRGMRLARSPREDESAKAARARREEELKVSFNKLFGENLIEKEKRKEIEEKEKLKEEDKKELALVPFSKNNQLPSYFQNIRIHPSILLKSVNLGYHPHVKNLKFIRKKIMPSMNVKESQKLDRNSEMLFAYLRFLLDQSERNKVLRIEDTGSEDRAVIKEIKEDPLVEEIKEGHKELVPKEELLVEKEIEEPKEEGHKEEILEKGVPKEEKPAIEEAAPRSATRGIWGAFQWLTEAITSPDPILANKLHNRTGSGLGARLPRHPHPQVINGKETANPSNAVTPAPSTSMESTAVKINKAYSVDRVIELSPGL